MDNSIVQFLLLRGESPHLDHWYALKSWMKFYIDKFVTMKSLFYF